MKRIIYLMCIVLALFTHINAYGTIYYVDPDDGYDIPDPSWGQSTSEAYLTIAYAISKCTTNDTIKLMDGDFVEARQYLNFGGTLWKTNRNVLIYVDEQITIEPWATSTPVIVAYNYTYDADTLPNGIAEVMYIDQPNVTIQNIQFDGYHQASNLYVKTCNVIYITPDADNTKILYCDFTHFGNDAWGGGSYDFYTIIAGGWPDHANTLDTIDIMYNTFHDNPFQSVGAHEIYVSRTSSAEIEYNHIVSNGYGCPLKIRGQCLNTEFVGNTVHGAAECFLHDENAGGGYSSGTIVQNNTFGDSLDVIDEDEYLKPFKPHANHIVTFEDNIIYEYSTADSRYIQGLTCKSSSTDIYAAQNNSSNSVITLLPNEHAPSPTADYGQTGNQYFCQGDMCTTSGYVIFCGQNSGGQQIVYSDDMDGTNDSSDIFNNTSYPNIKITALCSLGSTTYLTAIRDTANECVRIYESATDEVISGIPKLTRAFADVDSITAMAYDGSYVVFTEYKNGTSLIRKATLANLGSPTDIETVSGYIPAMCFAKGSLITAFQNGSTRRIYIGSLTDAITATYATLASKNFIALVGSSNYLYTVMHNDSGGNERKKIYFTKTLTAVDNQVYFYSQWYKDF